MALKLRTSAAARRKHRSRLAIAAAIAVALYGSEALAPYDFGPAPGAHALERQLQPRPLVGALTFVSSASASAATVTMPTHQKGDILVFFSYRGSSTTAPSRPADCADIGPTNTKSGTTQSCRICYKVATSSSETSGTHTNATELTVHVLRPDPGFTALPGQVAFSSSTTTTITFPALSLAQTDGTSWVLGFAGASNTSQTLGTAPTGMTNRQHPVGASDQAASHDTNGGVSSWSAQTTTNGTGNSVSATLEILCLPETLALNYVYGHIGGGANNAGRNQPGNYYVCPLSIRASGVGGGSGNTILFAFTCDGGATVSGVNGAVNGAFTQYASVLGGSGSGNLDTYVYYKQGIAAGQETVTVKFNVQAISSLGATNPIQVNTASPHGLSTGANVAFSGISGTFGTTLNGTTQSGGGGYTITVTSTTQFTVAVNGTGLTGSGGEFGKCNVSFTYGVTELYGVATSGGLGGSSSRAGNSATSVPSFTPTNNDANGGNFIWFFATKADATPASSSTHFVPGTGMTLLTADCNYAGALTINPTNGLTKCIQYGVQTNAAAIAPSFTSCNESGDNWNCIAVAIPISNGSGTPIPSGMSVNRISHFCTESWPTSGTVKMQLPVNGNFRILCTDDPALNTLTVKDSEGHTWTAAAAGSGFWYLSQVNGAGANPNLTIYVTGGGNDNELSFRFFDIIGADPSPIITSNIDNQVITGLSSFSLQNTPSPTSQNGMIFINVGVGQGPGLGILASPNSAGIWDLCTYTGEVDFDEMENADHMAHANFTQSGPQTWTFSTTNSGTTGNSTSGGWITVSGQPPPIAWVPRSAFRTPKIPGGLPYANVAARRAWVIPAAPALPGPLLPVEPWIARRFPPQIDVLPNIALRGVEPGRPIPMPVEPTYFKRYPPQIDYLPNRIAPNAIEPPRAIPAPIEPTYTKRLQWQADHPLNIAALQPLVVRLIPAPIEPTISRASRVQLDVYPNVAVRIPILPPPIPAPIDPAPGKRYPPQIDLLPNVAIQAPPEPQLLGFASSFEDLPPPKRTLYDLFPNLAASAPVAPIPLLVAVEPWINKRLPPQIDVLPNVTLRAQIVAYVPPPPIDVQLAPRHAPQPDVYPNIALRVLPPAYIPPPPVEVQLTARHAQQPDVYPNVAVRVLLPAYLPPPPVEIAPKRPRAQLIDQAPNIAARVAPAPVLIRPLIEPWIAKRYPPQIEIFPGLATFAKITLRPTTVVYTRAGMHIVFTSDTADHIVLARGDGHIVGK